MDPRKRWRVACTTLRCIRAFSLATENVIKNQFTPAHINARKRWRMVGVMLRSIRAFSLGRVVIARNQNYLPDKFVSSSSHSIVNIKPECFTDLVQLKNIEQLHQFGGVREIASALRTDTENGIQGDLQSVGCRRQDFGSNTIRRSPPKILQIVLEAFRDPIIIILLIFATLSLGFGIKTDGLRGCYDGGSILVAVFLVITVTASISLWSRTEFVKLSETGYDFSIVVIRNGQEEHISAVDAVVGDVVCLKLGDQVPADGLYIDGNSLQVDESNVTGEMDSVEVKGCHNPFMISGTKVTDGSVRLLVTAVGMNTAMGKRLSSKCYNSNQSTPLQMKLHKLTMLISMLGQVVASLVLALWLLRYFVGYMHDNDGAVNFRAGKTRISAIRDTVIRILATPVAIAATAIPEGLLLAFTITIAYSIKMMAAQQVLVKNISSCEAIASATVICTSERGTLTLNHLKASEFCFCEGTTSVIAPNVIEMLLEGVLSKSTQVSPRSPNELSESQIETAIQDWCAQVKGLDAEQGRANCTIHHPETSISDNTRSIIWVKKKNENKIHMHQRGEPEIILSMCSHYYDENGFVKEITNNARANLEKKFQEMKLKGLQCIAFAYKDVTEENGHDSRTSHLKVEEEFSNFIGIVGLKYPCQPLVREAVIDCRKAGVNVKMMTANEPLAARATAIECGILEPNEDITTGLVVEGPEFQNYTDEERSEKSDKIRVMARATTLHRFLMVQCLKQKGHVVAVTGDSIEDATVFKETNVGLSLGIQGTHMAKENSDIIILNDDFGSIATALRWGRGIYYKIQLYTQFQLTVSISSLVIDFVTAMSAREPPTINIVAAISAGKVPYATLQVLWVKLIMGSLAALALTIEKPAEELKELPAIDHSQPFITNIMWMNIVGQALYPIIICLTIQFKGESTFNLDPGVKDTMIFNIFVLWQLSIIFNTARFEKNILKGIQRKKIFWTVVGAIILLQVVIVELLKKFAGTKRLNWMQWASCVVIAVLSLPIGWLVKRIYVLKKLFFGFSSS